MQSRLLDYELLELYCLLWIVRFGHVVSGFSSYQRGRTDPVVFERNSLSLMKNIATDLLTILEYVSNVFHTRDI